MRLVCLGDSMTYGYGVPRSEAWPALAKARTRVDIINCGVNGDTTGGMLARFTTDVLAANPDAVLIMGGWNNIFLSGTDGMARANIGSMANIAASSGITPIIGIPLQICRPIRSDWESLADLDVLIPIYYNYVKWLCDFCNVFNFSYIHFDSEFRRLIIAQGKEPASYYQNDGLHPNKEGHKLLAEILIHALKAFV